MSRPVPETERRRARAKSAEQAAAARAGSSCCARCSRIRCFEDQVKGLFGSGLVRGSTHLCQGQEAVSVGVCSLLELRATSMTCTYRGHGAVLAAGAALDACFAEILGREGGLCGGKGGSMHLADFAKGIIGSNAIVGAQLPISCRGRARRSVQETGTAERRVHRRRFDEHRRLP